MKGTKVGDMLEAQSLNQRLTVLESQYYGKKLSRPFSQLSIENEMHSTGRGSESDHGISSTQIARLETDIKILQLQLGRIIEEKTDGISDLFKANLSENEIQNFDHILRS